MRLLSLTLSGQYKGLKDQTFNFESAQANIVAFIGLNGAGKSRTGCSIVGGLPLDVSSLNRTTKPQRVEYNGR
jgi:ABC-type polysaccharide/polyol phosphate transport system ATPase subunit